MAEKDDMPAMAEKGDVPMAAGDFQTAFWAAKHALALASAAAFSRHGVHGGQQFVLRSL